MDNTLLFFGLMRRAKALAVGAEDAYDAAREGRARLLALASDAAKNTTDGMENAHGERGTPLLRLPYTKAELGAALGRKECAAVAVTDLGFAKALCEKLGKTDEAATLTEKLLRVRRRKEKKKAGTFPQSGAAGRIAARKVGHSSASEKRGK
ncbi:MAG: ribosomal L7Ae/L30e/S12e/Gadd45 family protein [Clostridiaceae bacterium]|nr:ribosomal L7Ae/L30e/S12e/Gadd45 family protein [Clostridiaceae bacterium]